MRNIVSAPNPLLALPVADAKVQCSIDGTASDTHVTRLIKAAYRRCEAETGRALQTQTCEVWLSYLPRFVTLPFPPLISVTSVKYFDSDDVEQTLDAETYRVYKPTEGFGCVEFDTSVSTKARLDAVIIRFTCGYSTTPEDVSHAMALLVGGFFEHREAEVAINTKPLAYGVEFLLSPYRVWI